MSTNNATGRSLENQVELLLNNQSYETIEYKEWVKNKETDGKLLVKQFPYISIYESKCRTEFVLIDNGRRIRIECKWQQVSGSVDEKFPYLYLNAVERWEEKESILVVADIDERRLEAGVEVLDTSLVDTADHPIVGLAFNLEFLEAAIDEQCHPFFKGLRVDD